MSYEQGSKYHIIRLQGLFVRDSDEMTEFDSVADALDALTDEQKILELGDTIHIVDAEKFKKAWKDLTLPTSQTTQD